MSSSGDARPAFGGKQLARYRLSAEPKGRLPRGFVCDPRAKIADGAILAQNIVAHVAHPQAHLKIAATVARDRSDAVILDTINQISWQGPGDPEAALAILNSKIVSWYVYRFIVGRAIRTIHFDTPVTARIPLPAGLGACGRELAELSGLAREMLAKPSLALDEELEQKVRFLYGVGEGEGEDS